MLTAQTLNTMKCIYCSTQLSFPASSVYIQCPKCNNTMNPSTPTTNYISCVGCNTLLSHLPASLIIQCPKCNTRMQLPTRVNMAPQPPDSGRYSDGGGGGGGGTGGASGHEKRTRKKRKDPFAPKRASNAYMLFCKQKRNVLKKEFPDLPFGKIGAKLGELWRTMTPEEKRPYEDSAAADRERYKGELGSYNSAANDSSDENDAQPPIKKKTASNPVAPPTPSSVALGPSGGGASVAGMHPSMNDPMMLAMQQQQLLMQRMNPYVSSPMAYPTPQQLHALSRMPYAPMYGAMPPYGNTPTMGASGMMMSPAQHAQSMASYGARDDNTPVGTPVNLPAPSPPQQLSSGPGHEQHPGVNVPQQQQQQHEAQGDDPTQPHSQESESEESHNS